MFPLFFGLNTPLLRWTRTFRLINFCGLLNVRADRVDAAITLGPGPSVSARGSERGGHNVKVVAGIGASVSLISSAAKRTAVRRY